MLHFSKSGENWSYSSSTALLSPFFAPKRASRNAPILVFLHFLANFLASVAPVCTYGVLFDTQLGSRFGHRKLFHIQRNHNLAFPRRQLVQILSDALPHQFRFDNFLHRSCRRHIHFIHFLGTFLNRNFACSLLRFRAQIGYAAIVKGFRQALRKACSQLRVLTTKP